MSSNEYIQNALTSHQIYLQRYSGNEAKKVEAVLDKLFKNVLERLGEDNTPFTQERLVVLRREILAMVDELELGTEIINSADEFIKYESQYILNLLDESTKASASLLTVSPEYIMATATAKQLVLTSTTGKVTTGNINQLVSRFDSKVKSTLLNILNNGAVEGLPVKVIAQQIKAKTSKRTLRQSEALTRTILNHVGTVARDMVYSENSDIIHKEKFVATLDSRTTILCAGFDGDYFNINNGPIPPLHWNAIPQGELVTTTNGDIPIEDISVGDYVLTHRGRFKKVTATMSKPNESGVVRVIKDVSGRVIRMTDDHPALVGEGCWKRADRIKVGDKLHKHNSSTQEARSNPMTIPQNSPSIFDGEEIFSQVSVKPGVVTLPVALNNKLISFYSEISYRVIKYKLLREIHSKTFKYLGKLSFSFGDVFKKRFTKGLERLSSVYSVVGRVFTIHPFRVFSICATGLLSKSISPVRRPNTNTILNSLCCRSLARLGSGHISNVMFFAPISKLIIAKPELPLYTPKRLTKFNIVRFDKIRKFFSVLKVHTFSPFEVSYTGTVTHNGKVFNLEVEGDNSYLVNGVVVHNCRSIRVPVVDPKFGLGGLTGDRGYVSGSDRGTISSKTTYSGWLRKQPKTFQNEVLGEERAKLFRSGKVTLDKFVDANYRLIPLDELASLDQQTLTGLRGL